MAVAQSWLSSGNGTASSPYKIASVTDWNDLAYYVSYGNTYSGKYFVQTDNIGTVTLAVGCIVSGAPADNASFAGTYDGGGYTLTVDINDDNVNAPFRAVDGATIKNLIIAGKVAKSATNNHSAGLVGFVGKAQNRATTIDNCWVKATVGSGANNYLGGIVGHAIDAAVTMTGCAFTGTINAGTSEARVGGLIGWSNGEVANTYNPITNRITVTNCFFYGTVGSLNYFHPVLFGARWEDYVSISNTYHNKDYNNPARIYSGYKFAYTITAGSYVTVACSGSSTSYGVSKITAYAHGIVYDGRIYAGNGDSVGLTLGYSHSGYQITSYSPTNGTLSGSGSSYTLAKGTGNTVISANEARLYTVSTSTLGNGTVSVSASSAIAGTTITITPHPNTGYSVASVTTSPSCTVTNNGNGTYRFTMPSSNVTVTATFSKITYTITCSPSSGSSYISYSGTAQIGNTITVTAHPATGYQLSSITATNTSASTSISLSGSGNTRTFTMPAGNVSVTATFSQINYTVTTTTPGHGTVSAPSPKHYGDEVTVTTTPDTGYELTALTYTPAGGSTVNINLSTKKFTMPAANVTVTATFSQVNYTVTTNIALGQGTLTTSPASSAHYNDVITVTATPATGYELGTLTYTPSGGAATTITGTTFSMPANHVTVTAKFYIFHITSSADWETFCNTVNGGYDYSGRTVYLDNDITTSVSTIAGSYSKQFKGTFEGNKHTVTLTNTANVTDKGLIGYVGGSGNVQNVFVNATLSGTSTTVGAIVGTFASSGTISNVGASGTISSLATNMGGLVGEMTNGTIHSSYAVAALTGSATNKGGLVGQNAGTLCNCYSNATYGGTATTGGLVGANSGTVENCYAAGIASGVSALAGSNANTIQYCYADAVGDGYVGESSTAPSTCGLYGAVKSSLKDLDYMYRDNLITKSTNTYVGSNDAIADGINVYVNKHTPVWNGLVSALNQWVRSNPRSISGLAPWYRPLTTNINGDLPVLGFSSHTTLGAVSGSPKVLKYGTMDELLATYNDGTASVFHYGKATGVTRVPTDNVNVYIAEDAVLMQTTTSPSDFKATVGVTFDNSDRGAHAYDYWGNKLNYDWHLLSTPLSDLKTGAKHSSYEPSGNAYSEADITAIGGYFPDGLITGANPAVGGTIKWDFYTYYEPQYHWINLKRNKKNHYHQDYPGIIAYNEADQDLGDGTAKYIPGKGYEMAINQDTYMNAKGTLNKGSVEITLNELEPEGINYQPGANLVGNPYQGYLDLSQITATYPALDKFYIYDADQGVFAPVVDGSSSNPVIPSKYVHPHQAFFVLAPSNDFTLTFQPTWAGTTTGANDNSHYRDEADEPHYPLVNLFAEDGTGHRDLTVIEFHRPELGGALKLDYMRTAPFILAAHHAGTNYGIFFAPDDMERIPVRFQTSERCLITLTWSTYNGEFSKLLLIDNKLGVEHNMLTDNSYTFETSPDDYSSRFYIVYDCSGTGIEEGDYSTGTGTFAYIGADGNIVIETGRAASVQVIDVLGRVLCSTVCRDGVHTVSTSGIAKGVYILRLADGHDVKTQKIVVR